MAATGTKAKAKKPAKKRRSRTRAAGTRAAKTAAALGSLSREDALVLLQDMLLYRRFEEEVETAYKIGKIGGFCHVHIGQEAVAAGAVKPLRDDDLVITAYREHTQALAKGISPRAVMAELYGRVDGCCGGRGGSMHLFDVAKGFYGGHGIVGGQIPLGAGLAWAIKYRGGDQVCVCFLGDAAVNQGAFLESLNMSAVWRLPVIYVVENNGYGMGTAFERVSATDMEVRSSACGVPAHSVNGQDVVETYDLFARLAEEVRGGAGPQFVNAVTYRFRGHSMSDPVSGTYRSKEEVDAQVEKHDPVAILRDRLFEANLLQQEELEALDAEVRAAVQDSMDFAEASPRPADATLYDHVYSELNEHGRLFLDGRLGSETPRQGGTTVQPRTPAP